MKTNLMTLRAPISVNVGVKNETLEFWIALLGALLFMFATGLICMKIGGGF